MKRILATTLHDEPLRHRQQEYLTCLENNLCLFDHVLVFYEKTSGEMEVRISALQDGEKTEALLKIIQVSARPAFSDLFEYVDNMFPSALACIANADILFDRSLDKLTDMDFSNIFLAISRRETIPGSLADDGLIMDSRGLPNTLSADAWMYATPRTRDFDSNFPIGTLSCDSRLNYHALSSGYRVFNPCLDIAVYHVHDSTYQSSADKLNRKKQENQTRDSFRYPVRGVQWGRLEDCQSPWNRPRAVNWTATNIRLLVDPDGGNLVSCLLAAMLLIETTECLKGEFTVWLTLDLPIQNPGLYLKLISFQNHCEHPGLVLGFRVPGRDPPGSRVLDLGALRPMLAGLPERCAGHVFFSDHESSGQCAPLPFPSRGKTLSCKPGHDGFGQQGLIELYSSIGIRRAALALESVYANC